jgi:hypothetical protein
MLDWAFAHGTSVTPIGELVEPDDAAVSKPTASKPALTAAGRPQSPSATTPHESAGEPALPVWVGAVGGIGALVLIGSGRRRNILRKRR